MTLSRRKQAHAQMLGEAITKGLIRDWLEHGFTFFPKGIVNMREYCAGMADVHLPLSTSWKATKEEREFARKAATDLFDMIFALHENLKQTERNEG